MSERLRGIKAKIERAKDHIDDLEREVSTFLKANPYAVFCENERETGDRVFRVRIVREVPLRLALIAGDAIHNLRSCLDHLMWQLVEAKGGTPDRHTEFLFANTADDFGARCKGRIAKMGVSAPAMDLIEALRPYSGGNDGLYALHRLDITDKHRLLIAVGALRDRIIHDPGVVKDVEIRLGGPQGPKLPFKPEWVAFHYAHAHTAFPLKDGAEIHRIEARLLNRPDADVNPKFDFQIAFGEAGVFQGEPLVESLRKVTQVVRGTLDIFAALPELR